MRDAQNQAKTAATTAGNTASQYGADASGINANLTPFLTGELNHPQGYSQQDISSQLATGLAGAGGANAGIVGEANQQAATSRNAGGFQAALADAARSRDKAAAGVSEGIASRNADLKQQQQQDAAQGLSKMYGLDTSAQMDSMGQQNQDIGTEVKAGDSGWLQNTMGVLGAINQGAQGAAAQGFKIRG